MHARFASALVALGCLFQAIDASAQLTIEPPSPKAFFQVRLKVPGTAFGMDLDGRADSFQAAKTTVTMSGNKITVSPLMNGAPDFSAGIPPPNLDQMIGALPPGTYQVEVVRRATGRGMSGPLGAPLTFTVSPRLESEPLANNTDMWWNPVESGWGISIVHHASNQLFATLFLYGPDGKATWYVVPGGTFIDAQNFVGPLFRTTGPWYGAAFDPQAVQSTPAGTARIQFASENLDRAAIDFTIDGVPFRKSIQRQPF